MQRKKSSMQKVNFRSVDEFLDFLSGDELQVVEFLRKLIIDCVPGITEKLSYNVPFYKKNKGLFFIWPASVIWGDKQTRKGVRFAFQQGYLMADEVNYLDKGGRKQVYWKDFMTVKDINIDLLKAYIFEAVIIDEQFKGKK
jgi:hypothetical protein